MTNLPPSSAYTGLEVAVIGMAGRFPGAADVEEYWNNLVNGVESISYFEAEELRQAGWDEETLGSPGYVPARGVVSGVEYFDSNFFGYSPLEADMMDPQIRFLHECAWHALEDAGYNPHTYPGNIGICVGASPISIGRLMLIWTSVLITRCILISMFISWQRFWPTSWT